jgi:hypothetical protein
MGTTFWNWITRFGTEFVLHETIEGAFKKVATSGVEKVGEHLKTNVFGIGVNDEVLFLSACVYAKEELKVLPADLIKICRVIDGYPHDVRRKIILMIGKDEQETTVKISKTKTDGTPELDNNGKPVFKEEKRMKNVRGAEILQLLSGLTEDEIKRFLETSGATSTFSEKLSRTAQSIKGATDEILKSKLVVDSVDYLKNSKEKYENSLSNETDFEKVGKKLNIFGLGKFLTQKKQKNESE